MASSILVEDASLFDTESREFLVALSRLARGFGPS